MSYYVVYVIKLGQTLDPSNILFDDSDINNKSNSLTYIFSDWYVFSCLGADPDLMLGTTKKLEFSRIDKS